MKILLINSPNQASESRKNANHSLFPHIGIVQLATRLKEELKDEIEVAVHDGGISNMHEIKKQIDIFCPDLVGVSVLTPTYSSGLEIAQYAKSKGAITVLGDEHAIFFPNLILRNRPFVDFIITNDVGEEPFLKLIKSLKNKTCLNKVDSLGYRKNKDIILTDKIKYYLNTRNTVPDLSFIKDSLPLYAKKYNEAFGHFYPYPIKVVTVNNARGCENGNKRCSYCSIADLSINTGKPEQFWYMIEHYYNEHGIQLFFEVYDSFTASPVYIDKLISSMTKKASQLIENEQIELMVYARALGLIKKNNVSKFKQLGIKRVNIGLDSGDEKMLLAQRKNKTTDKTNLEALSLLKEANMTIHGSYIFGAPGETEESMYKTLKHIETTINEVPFSTLEASKLYPLANSPIWDLMFNHENPIFYKNTQELQESLQFLNINLSSSTLKQLKSKYAYQDLIDPDEIRNDWYKNFTHVTEDQVEAVVSIVDDMLNKKRIKTGKNIG